MARTDPMSGLYETLRTERDKLSSIVFRRKSPKQREELCTKRIHILQSRIDLNLEAAQRDGKTLELFMDLKEQAVRDRAAEVPSNERVERRFQELAEAPSIIEGLPKKEEKSS